jgi:RNA recognition motif-containing protein
MPKKLYIGNLNSAATGDSLKTLFSMFGKVEKAYVIPDKETGLCKGFGFVIMSDENEAQTALQSLNGKKCGDFTVMVQEAK